ncbi:hypothetical protein Tco_0980097 [Tanacetum coccineum]
MKLPSTRPKIEVKDNFELKGQFLKELRDNTFNGSDHEDANEHIEKVLEIVDLFYIPNITIDQVMLRAFPMSLTGAQGYRATAPGFYQKGTLRSSYDDEGQSMEETLSKFKSESAKRHEENSNLVKEIRASTDATIRNQGASIKILEIQIGQMSKVLQERGFRSLPSSIETNPRDPVKSISNIVKADSYLIRHMGPAQYATSTGQNRTLIKEKDPGSFTLPCFINKACFDNVLADLGASVLVNLIPRRSLDPSVGDYIELNDLNVPLELRRDQVDDLMPTIKEGEVVEEFRARNDARMVSKVFGYPSNCDHDKKIHIDCAYNLKFSCMIEVATKCAINPRFNTTLMYNEQDPTILKGREEDKMNEETRTIVPKV